MSNSKNIVLVSVIALGLYGCWTESDTDDAFAIESDTYEAFTIETLPGAFGCKDLKDGNAVLDGIRAWRGSPDTEDRKAVVEGVRKVFENGRCVWFRDGERITPIGGPSPVWGGEPLTKTDWFFIRRDDKGTITTPESTSEEYWMLAIDLDPEGVAEW